MNWVLLLLCWPVYIYPLIHYWVGVVSRTLHKLELPFFPFHWPVEGSWTEPSPRSSPPSFPSLSFLFSFDLVSCWMSSARWSITLHQQPWLSSSRQRLEVVLVWTQAHTSLDCRLNEMLWVECLCASSQSDGPSQCEAKQHDTTMQRRQCLSGCYCWKAKILASWLMQTISR